MPDTDTDTDPGTASGFEPTVTAFILIKTRRAWLEMSVPERIAAFEAEILPTITRTVRDVRSRFYDTEYYSAAVTDVWVWEARDHDAFQLVIEALRETRFWDHYFDVVDILVGVENGYAKNYGTATPTTISA